MMFKAKISSVSVAALFLAGSLRAAIVYSTGAPNLMGSSVDLGQFVGAESFTLSSTTTIQGARFFTFEYGPWDGTLNYFIFNANGGLPASTPLPGAAGNRPLFTKTFLTPSIAQYDFDLTTPLTLAAGTYWLGIQLDGPMVGAGLGWVSTTTPGAQISAAARQGNFSQWLGQGQQLALAISDAPLVVPEPTGVVLITLGLATFRFCKRPRRALVPVAA